MENKILEIKEIVVSSYKKYLDAILRFARDEIDKQNFKECKTTFLEEKKKVLSMTKSLDGVDFDPSLKFAFEVSEEEMKKSVSEYLEQLIELRKDGETKVGDIKDQIININLRKNVSRKEKNELCSVLLQDLDAAKVVEKANKDKVVLLKKKALFIVKEYGKVYRRFIKLVSKNKKENILNEYKTKIAAEKKEFAANSANLNKDEKKFLRLEHRSKMSEIKRDKLEGIASAKAAVHNSFLYVYSLKRDIKNNKLSPIDKFGARWENYKNKFKLSSFLMKNSLYIVIIIFFIACMIIAESQGNPLLTSRTIETIFIQSSTKVFFSLGVAGLILLGGTDLSIGRMTGMAATFSCLIMSQLVYETNIGVIDMTIPQGVAIVLGIFVCVFSTTLFSALAGFFTSRFKMHPFITTLSTQLLIYGLMMVCFSQVPAFTMNPDIKKGIVGEYGWRLIIYAVIAIAIVWFIWNKTKFGKNMYAVGDNKEAAAVSGINVFWVTMGVFIMAGVLYGLGGFLEGARIGNANPSTALGTELDAIAACVIGGLSFSGGKGKVSGAVIGTIIFATLTYCLTYIGLDINFQFIFKGLIILAAVCLDSLKFIKKK